MPYIHFSEQDKQMANDTDIVSYLKSIGESTERHGNEYWWEAPTGKVSIKGSSWFSQYERVGGGAVGFLQKFYGMKYPEAVQALLGRNAGVELVRTPHNEVKEKEYIPLEIPPKNSDMRRVFAYLVGERYIDREALHAFVSKGLIYEDSEYHNVVFLGLDENGEPKHIQKRATSPQSDYKGNVAGSNADYSFNYVGNSDKLFVFEAPIDMLAYISLHKQNWQEHSYVALCSTADCAVLRMLKSYPNIKHVYLCLDHDQAGIDGAYRVAESIHSQSDCAVWRAMPTHKDWDEDLKALNGKEAIPANEHTKLEYIKARCQDLRTCTDIYGELSGSKGYLLEQTFGRLHSLIEKAERSSDIKNKQSLLFDMAKTAVAFCYFRDRQTDSESDINTYIDKVLSVYKPHRDTKQAADQLGELKEYLFDLEKEMKGKDTFTQKESRELNEKMCELGMRCLSLDGAIGRKNEQTNTMSMNL